MLTAQIVYNRFPDTIVVKFFSSRQTSTVLYSVHVVTNIVQPSLLSVLLSVSNQKYSTMMLAFQLRC